MSTANNVNNISSVKHNVSLKQQFETTYGKNFTADYTATDLFVNCNDVNCNDISQAAFETKIAYDSIDSSACVVHVYLMGETLVAFYDEENEHGYIA